VRRAAEGLLAIGFSLSTGSGRGYLPLTRNATAPAGDALERIRFVLNGSLSQIECAGFRHV